MTRSIVFNNFCTTLFSQLMCFLYTRSYFVKETFHRELVCLFLRVKEAVMIKGKCVHGMAETLESLVIQEIKCSNDTAT